MEKCANGLPIEAKLQKVFESLIKTHRAHHHREERIYSPTAPLVAT
jgi:hypothetical protein